MPPLDPLRLHLDGELGDRYAIERELAGGQMSRVFVARERALGRRVVLKTVAPELATGLSAGRFEQEIQLLATLQHPNIVPVLAAGSVGGVPWFAMPFVEGDSLRARVAQGPLPEREAVAILRDVARALAYAHDRGVVHRDIKPDNILLSGDAAMVTDFGIAKAVSASRAPTGVAPAAAVRTEAGMTMGTPAYMAPEQVAGETEARPGMDLYALGCMAFELVAGRPPFTGDSMLELLQGHLQKTPPALRTLAPAVSAGYAALVARCLSKDPALRPAGAREVLQALDGLVTAPTPVVTTDGARLARVLAIWGLSLAALYLVTQAAVVAIGLPDFTVTWAMGAGVLGLPVVVGTWWIRRTAERASCGVRCATSVGMVSALCLRINPHVSWQRVGRGGVLAVGAVAVAVVAVMALRPMGMGPAASLRGAGLVGEDASVLLADFAAGGGDPTLGESLTQAMRLALERSTAVRLVPPVAVGATLRRMAREAGTPLSPKVAREVAQRAGVPLVVTGRVSEAGSGFLVTVSLEAAQSGRALATLQRAVDGPAELLETVDKLARDLRARVGESLREVHRTPPLPGVTTASMPALQAYSRAVRLGEVEGRFVEGLAALEEAVALDSTFASAWHRAAVYARSAEQPRSALLRFVREAYRHRDRVSPRERAEIEAYYLRETSTRGALAALLRDSTASLSRLSAATTLRELGRPSEAESLLVRELRQDSVLGRSSAFPTVLNLAAAQIQDGRLDRGWRTLARVEAMAPGAFPTRLMRVVASWRVGGVDSVDRALRGLGEPAHPAEWAAVAAMRAWVHGMRGELAAFRREAHRAESQQRSGMRLSSTSVELQAVVSAAVHLGEPARGVAAVDSLWRAERQRESLRDVPPLDRGLPALATAYAQLGRPDLARPLLNAYLRPLSAEERLAAWAKWQGAEGEIALAEGRVDAAVAAFRRAAWADSGVLEPAWSMLTAGRLARAHDRAGRADSAAAYYAQVVSGVYPIHGPLTVPLALRRLGELAEARGDSAEALRRYGALAALWRTADPALQPQVAEIRARLARLGTVTRSGVRAAN